MPFRNSLQSFPSSPCHQIHWFTYRHVTSSIPIPLIFFPLLCVALSFYLCIFLYLPLIHTLHDNLGATAASATPVTLDVE